MHYTHSSTPWHPVDPTEAIKAHQGTRARAEQMLAEAKTSEEKLLAQFWIDSADRQVAKWQAIAERGQR